MSSCTCSICNKKGYAWVAPRGSLNVVHDEGLVDTYSFGSKEFLHKFCGRCGTPIMGEHSKYGARINARVLQDLDFSKVEKKCFTQSEDLEPAYKPAPYTGREPQADIPNATVYHGSCHCGQVRIAAKLNGVLGETYTDKVSECNCSICQRCASIWIYPQANQVAIEGEDQLQYYSFAAGVLRKAFCKRCGVHVLSIPPTDEQVAALPAEVREIHAKANMRSLRPVTIRVLDGVDIRKVKTVPVDGWNMLEPKYKNP